MTRAGSSITAALAVALLASAACGNKKDDAPPANPAPTPPAKPAPALTLTATALHASYLGARQPAAKFAGKRVLVTGIVHQVQAGRTFQLVFTAGSARQQVSARFRDSGVAARDRAVAKGATATVDCQVRGRFAMRVELDDCVLK